MGKIQHRNQPCTRPNCKSSDAVQVYVDHAHCFSCGYHFPGDSYQRSLNGKDFKEDNFKREKGPEWEITDIKELPSSSNKTRLLSKEVMEFYEVKASYNSNGVVERYWYPFYSKDFKEVVGYKSKFVGDKSKTYVLGKANTVFGIEKFLNGSRRIVITEGEEDCLSIAQANYLKWKKFYPVISMGGANQTNYLISLRETLRKYEEVIIWFDNDEPGKKAAAEAAKIIGYDKTKIVSAFEKDANEVLLKYGINEGTNKILSYCMDAKPYNPTSLLSGEVLWEKFLEYKAVESIPYPPVFAGLQQKLKGIRKGEITLLVSGSGAGKSTIARELLLHIHTTTKAKSGLIALEESPAESTRILSGMAINRNTSFEEVPIEDLRKGFDIMFKDERLMVLDHVGSINDNSIFDTLEFMCQSGVEYIILDHLTILISEGFDGLDGLTAQDKVVNELKRIATKYQVWIGLISHLRKTNTGKSFEEGLMPSIDAIRGSGSTKQVSNDIIAFARNVTAEVEADRNKIQLMVLKARYTGLTGPAGEVMFNRNTGRLEESKMAGFGGDAGFEIIG